MQWEYLLGGGLLAAVAAAWRQIRSFFISLISMVVVTQRVNYRLGFLMLAYFEENWRRPDRDRRHGVKSFSAANIFVRPLGRVRNVAFENLGDTPLRYRKGIATIWYQRLLLGAGDGGATKDGASLVSFRFLRGTLDFEKLILEVLDWADGLEQAGEGRPFYIKKIFGKRNRQRVDWGSWNSRDAGNPESTQAPKSLGDLDRMMGMRPLRWTWDDLGAPRRPRPLDSLALRPELEAMVDRCRFWLKSRAWYEERGVPWKEGLAFEGAPGTGKTSLARALAEELNIPIYVFYLSTLDDQDLDEAWTKMLASAPCMALFEDVDAVFEGRKNIAVGEAGDGLTMDAFLNAVDGAQRAEGVLMVATTNHLDKLDPALLRPGRFGSAVHFLPLDAEGRLKLARRILKDEQLAQAIAQEGETDTGAEYQNRCFLAALKQLDAVREKRAA
jgi:hypothetical protein